MATKLYTLEACFFQVYMHNSKYPEYRW